MLYSYQSIMFIPYLKFHAIVNFVFISLQVKLEI